MVQILLQHGSQDCSAHGFGEVVVHARVEALLAIAADGGRGHGDDEHVADGGIGVLADEFRGVVAVEDGHLDVHEDEVEGLVFEGAAAEGFHGLEAVAVGFGFEAQLCDEGDGDFLVDGVVLGDADAELVAGDAGEVDHGGGGAGGGAVSVGGPFGHGVWVAGSDGGLGGDGGGGGFEEGDGEGDVGAVADL